MGTLKIKSIHAFAPDFQDDIFSTDLIRRLQFDSNTYGGRISRWYQCAARKTQYDA